jgi:hypothetical protein
MASAFACDHDGPAVIFHGAVKCYFAYPGGIAFLVLVFSSYIQLFYFFVYGLS